MSSSKAILAVLERNWDMVDSAIKDMDDATLARMPNQQSNSAAWILWHMNRVVDAFIHTRFRSIPQLWEKDGWHQKFGMSAGPENRGVGWTAQQIAEWKPPAQAGLVGYYEAVKQAARDYISSISEEELLAQRIVSPVPEPRSIETVLCQMTWDNVAHGGQIAYLRGYFQGMGWHR